MIKVAIDPGINGAVAIIPKYNLANVFDMPVLFDGKKLRVDGNALHDILCETITRDSHIFIEKVNAMPKQGVASSFNFGMSYGIAIGVAGALGVPYTLVPPRVWKKHAGLLKKPKDMARSAAASLYPYLVSSFDRKKDVDRAEAILIAHYGDKML